jgi:hypothetical protein
MKTRKKKPLNDSSFFCILAGNLPVKMQKKMSVINLASFFGSPFNFIVLLA